MLRALIRSIIILFVFIPAAAVFPLAAFKLCRTPEGAQALFWCGPWSCAFWTLLVSQIVGFKIWRGAAYVRALRTARGGYLYTVAASTAWTFFGLFASYACELGVIFLLSPSPLAMRLFPLATYAPVAFAFAWCSRG